MNYSSFIESLPSTGFPVTEVEFKQNSKKPLPSPPYLAFFKAVDSSVWANGKVVLTLITVEIELYTEKSDVTSQPLLEAWFNSVGVKFKMVERSWIDGENFYQTVYKVSLYG